MTVSNLRRLENQFLADQQISEDEASRLVKSTWDFAAVSKEERAELKAILNRDGGKIAPNARQTIEAFLGATDPHPAPPPEVIKSIAGVDPSSFGDDTIFLGRDGAVHGESGITPYTRAYDATKVGPLRSAHGSPAPDSSLNTAAETAALRNTTPGKSLDAAAHAFGLPAEGFEAMANSKDFHNDDAEYWWGKCHAWAWSALSRQIDQRVDVEGPEGQKGLWLAGQWLSRADLGNWMMGVADEISVNDSQTMFKSGLSASDLVKGTTQFMMNNGGGVVADVFNDKKKRRKEVWNQPFVSSDLTTHALDAAAAKGVLDLAKAEGVGRGAAVKQVSIVGTYGVEQGDGYEGPPGKASKTWNLYAVVDASGRMLTAYMADDEKLKRLGGLPTKTSDDLPEYFWKPKLQAIDDVLAGRRNWNVETDKHGAQFKFFVGVVLTRGVPASVRAAFEADLRATPEGSIDSARAAELAHRYPTVANAYSPEQWRSVLRPRGLDAKAFGAAWPAPAA
jgi:hypothetical protein